MKKYLLGMSAIAMLCATSCQDDMNLPGNVGESTTVAFNVSTPEIGTRSYSDGKTADVLQYAVYDAAGNLLSSLTNEQPIDITSKVELQLTTGNEYTVVFWAEAPDAPYTAYFTEQLADANVEVDYTGAKSNDENRDAFYAKHTFTVKGAQTENVKLYRPFAQLNIGTGDYTASTNAGYTPEYSYVKVPVSSTLNLFDGSVGAATVETFGVAKINKEETFPVDGYQYLAMNYLLVPADKSVVEVEFGYSETEKGEAKTRKVGSVPVQRNYRTNIYGQLLTSDVDINVEIVPAYNEPDLEAEELYVVAACGGEVTLTKDVELPKSLIVADDISMIINLNGYNIINKSESADLEKGDGIIVYGDLTINGEGTVQGNTRAVWARGKTGAKVRINGGNYVGAVGGNMTEVIYASGNGVIDIYGGTFEAKTEDTNSFAAPQYAVLNLHGNGKDGCKINVYGGAFKNFNPADNISENPKHNFCADGYKAIEKDGKYYVIPNEVDAVATTTADLNDALAAGQDVVLFNDIAVAKSEVGSNGYGATGISQLNGGVIDGYGNDLSVNAWGTWDSALNTSGGTIKNLNVTGGMRGIFVNHNSTNNSKVILENVVIDGTVYTISCDQGTNQGLEAYNSTFNGWTSYAATIGDVLFTNCSFGKGQGYAYCRPYAPTTFVGCDFAAGYAIDARAKVTFKNCTINGVALTEANLATLVTSNITNASVK
ncbi:MAG: DUF6562 domain-containing protein [Muribaculaceae bacterium]|nr:DUF6562 domain-containing protein [Muribaculaceae bacterium]